MSDEGEAMEELVDTLVFDLNRRPLCAPLQQRYSDIPVIRLNIASPNLAEEYTRLMRSMARRARDIAPLLYCNKAVTPFPNPHNRPARTTSASPSTSQKRGKGKKAKEEDDYDDVTKWGHSYFIIELSFKDRATGKDYDGMVLQLIICDNNSYLVGFRRCVYDKWSEWHYCSEDFSLPFFLQGAGATKLPNMEGDHKIRPDIGGAVTFETIFKELGYYPDERNASEMELAFLAAVLVFCEARRIVWVYMEVKKRIMNNEAARPLECTIPGKLIHEDYAWKDIKDWGVDSKMVLSSAQRGVYTYTPPGAYSANKSQAMEVGVKRKSFANLIAQGMERGHVGLIMREDTIVAPKGGELLRRLKNSTHKLGLTFREPDFRQARPGELDE